MKNNKSGITGVSWNKRWSRWLARIYVNGKDKYLGLHKFKKNAIKARKKAEQLYGYK